MNGVCYGETHAKSSHKSEIDVVLWSNSKNGVYKLLSLIDSFEWRGSLRYTFLLRGKIMLIKKNIQTHLLL